MSTSDGQKKYRLLGKSLLAIAGILALFNTESTSAGNPAENSDKEVKNKTVQSPTKKRSISKRSANKNVSVSYATKNNEHNIDNVLAEIKNNPSKWDSAVAFEITIDGETSKHIIPLSEDIIKWYRIGAYKSSVRDDLINACTEYCRMMAKEGIHFEKTSELEKNGITFTPPRAYLAERGTTIKVERGKQFTIDENFVFDDKVDIDPSVRYYIAEDIVNSASPEALESYVAGITRNPNSIKKQDTELFARAIPKILEKNIAEHGEQQAYEIALHETLAVFAEQQATQDLFGKIPTQEDLADFSDPNIEPKLLLDAMLESITRSQSKYMSPKMKEVSLETEMNDWHKIVTREEPEPSLGF